MFNLQHTPYDWQFTAESDKACLGYPGGCYWPRGKMLGGSHGMNAMLYLRGHDKDYDTWEKLGNPGWGWNDVLKYFKKSEANQDADFVKYKNGKYHSDKGLLMVGSFRNTEPLSYVYINASKELGYDLVDDLNAEQLLGYAFLQLTIHNGRRQTVAKNFLIPAKDRPNLHIIKKAYVTKINIDNSNTAKSVELTYNGTNLIVEARKEVVLSAGAVQSPHLLMLSGVGPRKHLEKFKIPVKKDLPVGQNLQDHLTVPMFYQFHQSSAMVASQIDFADSIYRYALHQDGPMATLSGANLIGHINTVNKSGYPDIQITHVGFGKMSLTFPSYLIVLGAGQDIQNELLNANKEAEISITYLTLLNPLSTGKIELASGMPTDYPKIYANYLEKDADMETLLRGVKYQIEMLNTKSFKDNEAKFIRLPLKNCDKYKYLSDDYLKCYIKHLSTTLFHPVGTSKMGPDSDKEAVVDSKLRVKGINNLRQIDAGIMPVLVSANTNAGTIMIAEKGADFIKEEWNNVS